MAGVTFEGVSKIYADGTRAVNDLELEVQDSEFMVLVGPSGCGKSTALRMVAGLEGHLNRMPRALPGGQRRGVSRGRAIVRGPNAFLMDEPLSNLDAKLRVQMRAEISQLQSDLRTTTIYVTHDQTEAMTMGDRVAVMRKGELQQVAAPQELYDQPVNLFVGGFIGSPAMNVVEAKLERSDGELVATLGSN